MTAFLLYDIKVALLIAVFYLFFRLLLARETLHRLNRAVLLFTAALSWVLPLCVITFRETIVVNAAEAQWPALTMETATAEAEAQPLWPTLAAMVFVAGFTLMLGKMLFAVYKVVRLIRQSELHPQGNGTTIAVTDRETAPFSWMHYIVLSRNDYAEHDAAVLAHEQAHVRYHHSWDVLFVDLLTALQWFNPALWLLRSDLRTIHEYEADAAVLSQGINARQYQYLLIKKAVGCGGYSVVNSITHSTLKNRINMMLKKKSSRMNWLKALYILPIAAVSLAVSARTVVDYQMVGTEKTTTNQMQPSPAPAPLTEEAAPIVKKAKPMAVANDTAKQNVVIQQRHILRDILYIIDGKETDTKQFNSINPSEMESVTVLKGEEALNAYGEKGKNGVVIVITRNKEEQPQMKKQNTPEKPLIIVNGKEMQPKQFLSIKPSDIANVTVLKYKEATSAYGERGKNGVIIASPKKSIAIPIILHPDKSMNPPLIIVDEKEMGTDAFSSIKPEEIERITVLKDKESTKAYGEKGKNGVIIVNTKKKAAAGDGSDNTQHP